MFVLQLWIAIPDRIDGLPESCRPDCLARNDRHLAETHENLLDWMLLNNQWVGKWYPRWIGDSSKYVDRRLPLHQLSGHCD